MMAKKMSFQICRSLMNLMPESQIASTFSRESQETTSLWG